MADAFWVDEVCFGAVQTHGCQQRSLSLGALARYLLQIKIPCVSAQRQSPESLSEWCFGQGVTLTNKHLEQLSV